MSTENPGENRFRTLPHRVPALSRRDFLLRGGGGFGAIALADLLQADRLSAAPAESTGAIDEAPSLAPRRPHHRPTAKSVIFLFIEGGPSHIDLFDPKPELNRLAGKPLPAGFKPVLTAMGETNAPLLACRRQWKRHGESGIWVSDWLPHTAEIVDDITVLRSCWADGLNHVGSVCQMNTGSVLAGRPSLGSWVTYGLGTVNQSLPSYVVLLDRNGTVAGGPRNWGTGFMPATYQGTELRGGDEPIANLKLPDGFTRGRQRSKIDFLNDLNRRHRDGREHASELEARIATYELAFRMQSEAPEAVDLSGESERTLEAYGLDREETLGMGRACLLARRLVERGVRFVQVYSGAGAKWDAHDNIEKNHTEMCQSMDRPVAALIRDLKQRGLLDETLVVWGGEFGRTPMSEKGDGRDHNPWGFTMWFAGGGAARGRVIGTTDEIGLHAVDDRAHVHDIHATILHLLGVDHEQLTYIHNGRPERATMNEGRVIHKVLA